MNRYRYEIHLVSEEVLVIEAEEQFDVAKGMLADTLTIEKDALVINVSNIAYIQDITDSNYIPVDVKQGVLN